jgi:hypothetical protein
VSDYAQLSWTSTFFFSYLQKIRSWPARDRASQAVVFLRLLIFNSCQCKLIFNSCQCKDELIYVLRLQACTTGHKHPAVVGFWAVVLHLVGIFFLLLHNLPPESRDQLHPFRSLSKQERKQWSNVITEWTQKLSERQKLRS